MCRWFAYIADDEACLLEDVLVNPAHAITNQVDKHYLPKLKEYEYNNDEHDYEAEQTVRNWLNNSDGFGFAWYSDSRAEFVPGIFGPRPSVYHTLLKPLNDPAFLSISQNVASRAVFAHVRAASPGSPINIANVHPWVWGRYTFMHNGGVGNFKQIRRSMLGAMSDIAVEHIVGTTDSEHLAMLFFTYLAKNSGIHGPRVYEVSHSLESIKVALEEAITTTLAIQKDKYGPVAVAGSNRESSSLNVAICDGDQLLCIRFRNHPKEHPPSLYLSTTAGSTLNGKYPGHPDSAEAAEQYTASVSNLKDAEKYGKHVIISSEPTTYDEKQWDLVPKNHCVMVGRDMKPVTKPLNINWEEL